jgi:hypothetical protein
MSKTMPMFLVLAAFGASGLATAQQAQDPRTVVSGAVSGAVSGQDPEDPRTVVAQPPEDPRTVAAPQIAQPPVYILPPVGPPPPPPEPPAPLSETPDLHWADGPPAYVHDAYFARSAWGARIAVPPSDHPLQWKNEIWSQGKLWFVVELDGAPDQLLCLRWRRGGDAAAHDECQAMPAGRARLSYATPSMYVWSLGTYHAELVTVADKDAAIDEGEPLATLAFGAGGWSATAAYMGGDSKLPSFPWPPPRFTSKARIERDWLVAPEGTLGEAAERLELALKDARYELPGYYAIPGGFAMATRMEQIEPDGTPVEDASRWLTEPPPRKIQSLADYLRALVTAREGFYRVIVFTFTDQPVAASDKQVSGAEAQAWSGSGGDRLPEGIASAAFSRNHRCLVLVYEFRKLAGSEATANPDGAPPASVHLERSGILAALQP